jgi:hypothetical protein
MAKPRKVNIAVLQCYAVWDRREESISSERAARKAG